MLIKSIKNYLKLFCVKENFDILYSILEIDSNIEKILALEIIRLKILSKISPPNHTTNRTTNHATNHTTNHTTNLKNF